MTVADELRAAMALIEDESRWCRGAYARGKSKPVGTHSSHATRRCAFGALMKVSASADAFHLLMDVGEARHNAGTTFINDNLGHAAVLECYREAIRRAEEQP